MEKIEKDILSNLSLKELDLSNRRLTQLPTSIVQLTNLKYLYLYHNKLTEIPTSIGNLTSLQSLGLTNNQLTKIPSSIGQLTNLQYLFLDHNQLTTIPTSIQNLQSLKLLYLSDNRFQFPFSSYQKDYESKPTVLFQFLKDISTHSEKWTQVKLVTIGHGRVGKTTLIKALKQETEKSVYSIFSTKKEIEHSKSTVGIDIHDIEYLNVMSWTDIWSKMNITVWDFAGQLEYSVNHQYFLSSWNAIYLLVIDVSQSIEIQNEHIQYWIRYLKTHIQNSDDISIIIVGNRVDQIEDEKLKNKTISNLESLKGNKVIFDYVMLSAKQMIQIQNLVDILRCKCLDLLSKPEKFTIPKLYKLTAERLQSEKEFLIDAKQYFSNWEELLACFIFLHNIGVIVYNSRTMKICTKPGILSKLMSCFAFNPVHEEMMDFPRELRIEKGQSILTEEVVEGRIKKILGETNSIKLEEAIQCLEEFDYCFKLSKEEENAYKASGYLFPSLRPEGCFALDKEEKVKTLGIRILNDKSQFEPFFFFRFQVASHKLHQRKNVIYSNSFRLQKENNFATIWFGKKGDIQLVIQGEEPVVLWKEINKIIDETSQDFPGIQLKITYLCPGCVIELCMTEPLKNLPDECETMFSEGEERIKEESISACQRKFHKATRKQIEEGFSKISNNNSKESKYSEKKKIEEMIQNIEKIMKEKNAKFIHEIIKELMLNGILCSFLGENWMSFADYFNFQSAEIRYSLVSNEEKVRMVFMCINESPENVPIDKLIAYLNRINK